MVQVSLKCQCGAVRGVALDVSPANARRIVCLCDDCQAYAHYLGKAKEIMDSNGGTDICPVTPSRLQITQGAQHLQCLRLTKTGMFRWYAGCCKTPIANTMGISRVPFAGVVHSFMDHAADRQSRDEALGPIRGRIFGKFGVGPLPPGTHQKSSLPILLPVIGFLLKGVIQGLHQPSPFFDKQGQPLVEPYVLTRQERDQLRPLCGPI
ncbi:MAG: DUF6151 family protein [Proteobacteria bacterium]|nr:DUF6151 family protein [Pseudomonadota bacterium]